MSKNTRGEIFKVIEKNWPLHETEIARKLGLKTDKKNQKHSVARVHYHVRALKDQEKIITKKIGGSLVIWPHEIEKLRFVHEMLK